MNTASGEFAKAANKKTITQIMPPSIDMARNDSFLDIIDIGGPTIYISFIFCQEYNVGTFKMQNYNTESSNGNALAFLCISLIL